mgnify:CR=1 FL=1
MFDYMYLRLVYLYDDRKFYLTNEPLWVRFCVWFLHTFFKERLCIDELRKQDVRYKRKIKDLERRFQMLKEAYLKVTGELAADEYAMVQKAEESKEPISKIIIPVFMMDDEEFLRGESK